MHATALILFNCILVEYFVEGVGRWKKAGEIYFNFTFAESEGLNQAIIPLRLRLLLAFGINKRFFEIIQIITKIIFFKGFFVNLDVISEVFFV